MKCDQTVLESATFLLSAYTESIDIAQSMFKSYYNSISELYNWYSTEFLILIDIPSVFVILDYQIV
jgi:hypothetical protein